MPRRQPPHIHATTSATEPVVHASTRSRHGHPNPTTTAHDPAAHRAAAGSSLATRGTGNLVVALVVTATVMVTVLYGTGREATQPPRPDVAPVQPERSGADDPAAGFDHEHQSLRSTVRPEDAGAPAAESDHEHQSLRTMRDRDR